MQIEGSLVPRVPGVSPATRSRARIAAARPARLALCALAVLLGLVAPSLAQGRRKPGPAAQDRARAEKAADEVTAETRKMARRLAAQAESEVMAQSSFNNVARAAALRAQLRELDASEPGKKRTQLRFFLGSELLRAGEVEEAVEMLTQVYADVEEEPERFAPDVRYDIASTLAIAHLRQGELENCVARHGIDSCLFPIRGGGIHVEQSGARAAIAVLEQMLARQPDDLRSRWILNIAYMAVGEHPDGVKDEWLIPPQAFESDCEFPRFLDVAPRVGLAREGRAGGCVVDDFDGDLDLDVLTSSMGLSDPLRYYENAGDGTFVDRTQQAGLTGLTGGLNVTSADYDNDGQLDVYVLRGGWFTGESGKQADSLLHNEGGGRFSDATKRAGMLALHPSQAGAFGDYDNDGWVDLFIGNETALGYLHPCQLYHNNGDGTFTEVAAQVGVGLEAFVKGAAWGDYDNDGRIDLYVSCNGEPNRLYHNDGPAVADGKWRFTEVGRRAGVTEPLVSFPTWFFDFDNDGWLDIFVSGYTGTEGDVAADYLRKVSGESPPSRAGRPCIYRNNGDGTFTNVAPALGVDDVILTMGSNYGDLDNDGWLDFYLGTGNPEFRMLVPNRMFKNDGGRRFLDVTTAGGFGHLQKGHGVAFADIDQDGDQDVYLVIGGAYTSDTFRNALYENPGFGNRWVTLQLEGVESNRSALGARIRVHASTPSGPRVVHALVSTGGSFGATSLRQGIGLGDATAIERVEITWPATGKVEVLTEVALDRAYRVREGSGKVEPLDLQPIPFAGTSPALPPSQAAPGG